MALQDSIQSKMLIRIHMHYGIAQIYLRYQIEAATYKWRRVTSAHLKNPLEESLDSLYLWVTLQGFKQDVKKQSLREIKQLHTIVKEH